MGEHLRSIRALLDWLARRGELLDIGREIDPRFEIAGLIKQLDNGLPLVFSRVKGYPGSRVTAGLFSRLDRMAQMFGAADDRAALKRRGMEAAENPLPAVTVRDAPCQEIVRVGNIDIGAEIPVTTHTGRDPGPILSGGVVLLQGPGDASDISYKRIHFQGADWASMFHVPGTHSAQIVAAYARDRRRLPLTINLSPPPAVAILAAGGLIQSLLPFDSDELAIAGSLAGHAVELCQAKTVDAYAIAESEWVIEGYIDTAELVSENPAAAGDASAPFFPEYHGYIGKAQATYKFQATAVTRRGERPIYYAPLAHSFESPNMQVLSNRALQLAWLWRQWPKLVLDINSLPGMKGRFGMVVQVAKGSDADDEAIRPLLQSMFDHLGALRLIVVVDADVDIYDADEVLWALSTRMNAERDMLALPPTAGPVGPRSEVVGPFAKTARLGFDATVPCRHRVEYDRGQYPEVEARRWLDDEQLARVAAMQSGYARLLAKIRA